MSDQYYKVPVVRFQNDQLVLFEQFPQGVPRSDKQRENEKNLTRGDYNGYMSPKTKSKVKKYLGTWVDSIQAIRKTYEYKRLDKQPYLTFVTLTLPSQQIHEDNEIKRKCLTPFIATLQRKWNVWHYFWRAEAQKNGNIHFHIIVDSYIHHGQLRAEWNKCINKLGYVDQFAKSFQHDNPNSTDIHGLRDIQSPASYLIKYCTKTDNPDEPTYRKINGRIHGCSDGLRELSPYESLMGGKEIDFINRCVEDESSFVFDGDEFKIVKCSVQKMLSKYWPELSKKYFRWKVDVAKHLYTIQLPEELNDFIAKVERKRLIQLELFEP
jgi:hypothetical protein